ncbi:hypothetical protein Cflav_PD2963 [Pedosphaera parvula Ellin514]|uniref:Uncharacterized protein n=1 Tax=Pedosphaera parvula (strain Ellin514) TaxID=320771 RepID=B9XIK4_PEDPL|nr:hypothetical protein Cflav_PD2963 [Pedosphaera parvula Ellin514]
MTNVTVLQNSISTSIRRFSFLLLDKSNPLQSLPSKQGSTLCKNIAQTIFAYKKVVNGEHIRSQVTIGNLKSIHHQKFPYHAGDPLMP